MQTVQPLLTATGGSRKALNQADRLGRTPLIGAVLSLRPSRGLVVAALLQAGAGVKPYASLPWRPLFPRLSTLASLRRALRRMSANRDCRLLGSHVSAFSQRLTDLSMPRSLITGCWEYGAILVRT